MADSPRALILGVTGQDGSYLAEHLLNLGYEVHGTCRTTDLADPTKLWRINNALPRLRLHPLVLSDLQTLRHLVQEIEPHRLFHLAGTRKGFDEAADPHEQVEGEIAITHTLLTSLQACRESKVLLASSSEIFSRETSPPQSEDTPVAPTTYYGIAKATALHLARIYRMRRAQWAACAILFNHESPRRGEGYVSRKISLAAARIAHRQQEFLVLGNLDAQRDWGHARSFARGMIRMTDLEVPQDLVLATGRLRTVREFVDIAFRQAGLNPAEHLREDPSLQRPEQGIRQGNPGRAEELLGWRDEVRFEELVREMVDADLERVRQSLA